MNEMDPTFKEDPTVFTLGKAELKPIEGSHISEKFPCVSISCSKEGSSLMAKVIKSVPFINEQKDEKTKTTVEFFKWIGYMVLLWKIAF